MTFDGSATAATDVMLALVGNVSAREPPVYGGARGANDARSQQLVTRANEERRTNNEERERRTQNVERALGRDTTASLIRSSVIGGRAVSTLSGRAGFQPHSALRHSALGSPFPVPR
jgi:hypothetical protein